MKYRSYVANSASCENGTSFLQFFKNSFNFPFFENLTDLTDLTTGSGVTSTTVTDTASQTDSRETDYDTANMGNCGLYQWLLITESSAFSILAVDIYHYYSNVISTLTYPYPSSIFSDKIDRVKLITNSKATKEKQLVNNLLEYYHHFCGRGQDLHVGSEGPNTDFLDLHLTTKISKLG